MPTHFPAFVLTVAVLAILPGANNVSITRQTLVQGRRAGLLTVAGASTGILVWAIAAAVGLSAVLLASPGAYLAIRIGGAAVLCALGAQTLWSLRHPALAVPSRSRNGNPWVGGLSASASPPASGIPKRVCPCWPIELR